MNNYTEQYFSNDNIVNEYTQATSNIGLWNSERQLINRYTNKNATILDIGCGAGRVSFGLYSEGYKDIFGIDLSHNMIERANNINNMKGYNIDFRCESAEELTFIDNTFDMAIFSFNGLCTIPNVYTRSKVIKEINRVLKPSGTFVFTADGQRMQSKYKKHWNMELQKWADVKQDERIQDYGDIIFVDKGLECFFHFFSKEELIELLNKSGFKLLKSISLNRFKESKEVLDFCPYGRFWIAQKI